MSSPTPITVEEAREEAERRRKLLLRGAALAGGSLTLGALLRPAPALAVASGFNGYNDVTAAPFNADPTGTNDSTSAIQACIDQSAPATGPYATVYFPPGTYKVMGVLRLHSKSTLVGHGRLSVLKAAFNPPWRYFLTFFNNSASDPSADDVRIEDLTLDGSGLVMFAMLVRGKHVFVRGVEAFNSRSRCATHIDFDGDGRFGEEEALGSDTDGDGRNPENEKGASFALDLRGCSDVSVIDCYVHDWGRDGIVVAGSSDVVVRGNLVVSCQDDHITLSGAKRAVCVDNICISRHDAYGTCIALRGGGEVTVAGNLCWGSVRGGVEVNGNDGTVPMNIQISGNTIVEPGNIDGLAELCGPSPSWGVSQGSGITLHAFASTHIRGVDIRDNVITAPRSHGIYMVRSEQSTIRDVSISSNSIWINQAAGYLDPSVVGSAIASEYIGATGDTGETSRVSIRGNDIRGAVGPGVKVTGINTSRFDVQDNRILDSGKSGAVQPGILLDGVQGASVIGNRAQDTRGTKFQQYGLSLANPALENLLLDNDFTGNAVSGGNDTVISISGGTAGSRLRIRDNPGYNPWAGSKQVSGLLTGGPVQISGVYYWWKDVTVNFDTVSFPTDSTPKVLLRTDREGYAASAISVSRTGFTARVWAATTSASQPSANDTVTVYWVAEPVD